MSIFVLFLAALMEAGGDAVIRRGLQASGGLRALWFAAGAAVLFAYGYTVNRPPWKFGELLGLYVVFFFAVAQAISMVTGEIPARPLFYAGGCLIIAGGLLIAWSMQAAP